MYFAYRQFLHAIKPILSSSLDTVQYIVSLHNFQ